jgi:hypothetical protein
MVFVHYGVFFTEGNQSRLKHNRKIIQRPVVLVSGGHPPESRPRIMLLNFSDWRTGVFSVVSSLEDVKVPGTDP